jgi:hypothetical protein
MERQAMQLQVERLIAERDAAEQLAEERGREIDLLRAELYRLQAALASRAAPASCH